MTKNKFDSQLKTIAWELTGECNFNCIHCYNSGSNTIKHEFGLEKALKLCDEIAELKASYVLLTGGEVLLSNIWKPIAKRLIELGIQPGLLTNGWLLDKEIFNEIKSIGISWIGLSVDGLKNMHDKTRREGSFDKIMNALEILRGHNFFIAINTTVHKENINELSGLLKVMNDKDVNAWQIQLAIPEGNLSDKNSLMLVPEDIDTVIDFAYNNYKTSKTKIVLGDCIGHYNQKEIEIRSKNSLEQFGTYNFVNGCQAGKRVLGIKANGDITGCIALGKKHFIAGNIYERSLVDIWNDENSFAWNRKMDTSKLKGTCRICVYKEHCRSGCPSLHFDKNFQIRENKHCSYNVALTKKVKEIESENDINILLKEKEEAIQYQNKYLVEIIDKKLDNSIKIKNTIMS